MKNKPLLIIIAIVAIVAMYFIFSNKDNINEGTDIKNNIIAVKEKKKIPEDLVIPKKSADFISVTNTEAIEIFHIFINNKFGENTWNAKEYNYDSEEGLLTVKNFESKIIDGKDTMDVLADEIYLRTSINKDKLLELLAAENWEGQKEVEVFDFFGLKNLNVNIVKKVKSELFEDSDSEENLSKLDNDSEILVEEDEVTQNLEKKFKEMDLKLNFSIDKINLKSFKLKELASGEEASKLVSFLKALKLAEIEVLNLKITAQKEGDEASSVDVFSKYNSAVNVQFSLDSENYRNYIKEIGFPYSEEIKHLLALSMDSRALSEFKAKIKDGKEPPEFNVDITLDYYEFEGFRSFLEADYFSLENFAINIFSKSVENYEPTADTKLNFLVESYQARNYNLLNYINQFTLLGNFKLTDEEIDMYLGLENVGPTLANIFFGISSQEISSMKNLSLSLNGMNLSLKEMKQQGPLVAAAPGNKIFEVEEFIISLPKEEPEFKNDIFYVLYTFAKKFGKTDYIVNIKTKIQFDELNNIYTFVSEKFEIKDLLNISGKFSLIGLDEKTLAALKKYKKNDLYVVETREKIFKEIENLTLTNINLRIEDINLLNMVYSYFANGVYAGSIDKDEVRDMTIAGLPLIAKPIINSYTNNPDVLLNTIKEFLYGERGGKKAIYEINTSSEGLKVAEYKNYIEDKDLAEFLDKFDFTVKVNNGADVDIKFKEKLN